MGIFTDDNGNIREDYVWTTALKDNCMPYPIQFANIERLRKNDAVYIFDETGSGKTISSGLMTIDYLYNHPKKRVLILTAPQLVDKSDGETKGQFLDDWFDKLPFEELSLEERIEIDNYWYGNIANKVNKQYGLIILDEAHEYLEAKQRFLCLEQLRAEKIIIMTATPIKSGAENLSKYCDIADTILGKENDRSWLDFIPEKNGQVICSLFDTSIPVTRYFKDTINALKYDGYKKTKAIRKLPQMWEYSDKASKIPQIISQIASIRSKSIEEKRIKDRFIIFTRTIETDQESFREYLINNSYDKEHDITFVDYDVADNIDERVLTYVVINGKSDHKIGEFSHNGSGESVDKCPLPDIIIVTAKIGEAGVNLPGYDYVINYHISGFPSVLEQRFGRIDRMGNAKNGTLYESINVVYPFSNVLNYWDMDDSDEKNFISALDIYKRQVISRLPGRNVIFTKRILEKYYEILQVLKKRTSNIDKDYDIEFKAFMDEKLDTIKDKIFYFPSGDMDCLKVIPPTNIEKSSEPGRAELIAGSEQYKEYAEDFKKSIEVRNIILKCRTILESFLEEQFLASAFDSWNYKEGCFDRIFGYPIYEILDVISEKYDLNQNDLELLKKYGGDEWIRTLPFFVMIRKYGQLMKELWSSMTNATFNVLFVALNNLYWDYMPEKLRESYKNVYKVVEKDKLQSIIYNSDYILREKSVREDLYRRFLFQTSPDNETICDNRVACSNWYKLAFVSLEECYQPGIIFDLFTYVRTNDVEDKRRIREKYKDCSGRDPFFDMVYTNKNNIRKPYKGHENACWTQMVPIIDSRQLSTHAGYVNIAAGYLNAYLKKNKIDLITYCCLKLLVKPSFGMVEDKDNKCFGMKLGSGIWFDAIDRDIDSIKML